MTCKLNCKMLSSSQCGVLIFNREVLLGRKVMTNLDSILKSRDIILSTKVLLVKAMVFPVASYVWMWELDCKESWVPKKWCFWTVVLKTLESPLDCKEIQPVYLKGNQSWIFIGSALQFSSVAQSCPTFVTPWIAARQSSLSITNSQSSLRLTSIKSVMTSSHLILCRPLLLLPPIPPSIRVF